MSTNTLAQFFYYAAGAIVILIGMVGLVAFLAVEYISKPFKEGS